MQAPRKKIEIVLCGARRIARWKVWGDTAFLTDVDDRTGDEVIARICGAYVPYPMIYLIGFDLESNSKSQKSDNLQSINVALYSMMFMPTLDILEPCSWN
jgi:hypothetical protein